MSLYKKHFVGKHTYGKYGQGEHFPEQEIQRTHTATCLIYHPPPPPNVNVIQEATKRMNNIFSRNVNCVKKISGYKYIKIFQFI